MYGQRERTTGMKALKENKFQRVGVIATVIGALASIAGTWAEQKRSDEKLAEAVEEELRERGVI